MVMSTLADRGKLTQVSAHMTGYSAVGSAGALGASGRKFEPCYSDILVRFNHNEASNFPFRQW